MLNTVISFAVFAAIGLIAALAGAFFIDGARGALDFLSAKAATHPLLTLLLPVAAGGMVAALLAICKQRSYSSLGEFILVAKDTRKHNWRRDLAATAAAFFAVAGGISVGQYGPVAHLGGSAGLFINRIQKWGKIHGEHAAACGVAAAIAAAFNAPITAILFTHEVILRNYSVRAFTPIAVCAVVGYTVSTDLLHRQAILKIDTIPELHLQTVLFFIVFGILFGGFALVYLSAIFRLLEKTRPFAAAWKLPLIGACTGALALAIPEFGNSKLILGGQFYQLTAAMFLAVLLAKFTATILALGGGFAGGIVSPTLIIGGLAGGLAYYGGIAITPEFAEFVPLPTAIVCGMAALTAPVLGAPITGVILVMELSQNYPNAVVATIAVAIAVRIHQRLGGDSYYNLQIRQLGESVP